MKRAALGCLILIGGGALILFVAFFVFLSVTEKQRAAAIAQLPKPASVLAHERLVARLREQEAREPGTQVSRQLTSDPEVPDLFPHDVMEILAGYERLFAMREERLEDNPVWQEIAYHILGRPSETWTTEERATVQEFLEAQQDLIHEVRRMAARGGPFVALDVSESAGMGISRFEHLRSLQRFLRVDAAFNSLRGDYDVAVEDIIAGMQLANALAQEPLLISHLVRSPLVGLMVEAIQDSFHGGDLSPELLHQLLDQIAQSYCRKEFADSLFGDIHLEIALFSQVREEGIDWKYVTLWLQDFSLQLLFQLYCSPPARPWLNMDETAYVTIAMRLAEAAKSPYYEVSHELDEINDVIANLPRTRVLARMALTALSRAAVLQAHHEARLDLSQMGLLIEHYHGLNGAYPETLDAIAPELGGAVPVDPFTGQAYRYRSDDDDFLLYSVGPDGVDDGGRHAYKDGDIVWRGREEE